ncbi:MAG: hypothetical protein OSA51_06795 [Octadecabacter sp.]|nr:hypothetical protein [Octadecabacter sp.]
MIDEIDGLKKVAMIFIHEIGNIEPSYLTHFSVLVFYLMILHSVHQCYFLAERIIKADCPKDGEAAGGKLFIMVCWTAH